VSDDQFAMTGRALADVLMRYARARHDDDKKAIAQLQTDLCRIRRDELSALLSGAGPDAPS
jgi:hypothetical protein